jgi:hypothetical protein
VAVLVLLLAVVIALLAVLVAGLLRSHAEILRALGTLGVGLDPDQPVARSDPLQPPRHRASRAGADLAGRTPTGDAVSVSVVGADHPTLVTFLTSGCSTCAGFWTAFSDPGLRVPGGARIVVATKGAEAESPSRLAKFAPPDVPVVMSSEAWEAYDVPVAPYFALVDGPSGDVIGEGAAATWDNLRQMIEQALDDAGMASGRKGRRRRESPERRVDGELLKAGIEPGDPRLYAPDAVPPSAEAGSQGT